MSNNELKELARLLEKVKAQMEENNTSHTFDQEMEAVETLLRVI